LRNSGHAIQSNQPMLVIAFSKGSSYRSAASL
jgi:hypothetical protein